MSVLDLVDLAKRSTIKTYNEKGQGKKQCSNCKVIVGVRNKVCICGRKFVKQEEVIQPKDPEVDMTLKMFSKFGIIPSGTLILTPI